MNITSDCVSEWLTMRLHEDDGTRRELCAALQWKRADPYTVHAIWRLTSDDTQRWAWSRNLLIDGLIKAAGAGDMRVQPIWDSVAITLANLDGRAYLLVNKAQLARFLEATTDIVPLGGESYDLDVELAFLLADGEAAA